MGLKYPEDLAAWQRWQRSSAPPLNRMKATVTSLVGRVRSRRVGQKTQPAPPPSEFSLYLRGDSPRIVTVMELFSPTAWAAQEAWLRNFDADDFAVAAPSGQASQFGPDVREIPVRADALDACDQLQAVRVVVAPGHYLPIGAALYADARARGAKFVVVQHGLLTAYNPPLPPHAHVLAWSEADAAYWTAGRSDVTSAVVGSQLLMDAAKHPGIVDPDAPSTFLGQLHGAELPQLRNFMSATLFCRRTGAHYRPHPGERDLGSRLLHRVMKALGVTFADTSIPLAQLRGPIVSAFSTGVLEAAAKGLPAYVHYDPAPVWLQNFWQRYGMSRYATGVPTPAPALPDVEPSTAIAAELRKAIAS